MSITYKLNRTCPTCGVRISDKNKSGFCKKHLDRTGENNPFFGKTHSKETREILKIKCKEATTKMWQDEEYRNKVIQNATGLKRDEKFKETQRQNAYKQFQDKHQRDIRSERMR